LWLQVTYKEDLSSRESIPNKPSGANRKRRAESPGPEVEVLLKKVKIETVALSDSEDEEEIEEHDEIGSYDDPQVNESPRQHGIIN